MIMPYDYPARSGHFLNTHQSLMTTLSINAMMTLVTMITMMTKITNRSHEMLNDMKGQMT